MPRLAIFDGLPSGAHTWYEDAETGAIVPVYPGSQIPTHKILDPEHYAEHGLARIEGVEDGTDGRIDRLMKELRRILAEIAPLPGDPKDWTLDDMVASARQVEAEAVAAREAFAAAEAAVPASIDEIQAAASASATAQDGADGGTSGVASTEPAA